ncbi:Crp/Fnr family transcriptional regulator [Pontibacillus sp. HMF3514]|uniref:Crp/Fnr family transcriptional regulator n=1 Tax=Pontibacillus sp. HMF3514 TaxID=2692425 RepID=UPI00131FCD00|nr:Crp/Fnr family transcriptional regulator [Pontibacillus sp. HMF3514]QHE53834.1 cyclic nucleotide-binding domain-containing protein [Pontibacillus sp. HMF3514]
MNRNEIKDHFRTVPLFKELSESELDPFIEISSCRIYNPRSIVFMQGDKLDRVFFIHSGTVKIYKMDQSGKEQIVSVLQSGEMFPHAGFFRGGDFPANAEIVEKAQLIVTPIKEFENILILYPELCIKLFRVLGEKIIDLHDRLEEKILNNTYEQVIKLLIRLSKTNGRQSGDHFILTTHFTNRELAKMIGTTRETVSRTLNQLKKQNLLKIDEKGYYIIHPATLERDLIV